MLGLPKVQTCGQKGLADDGYRDWDEEINNFLDNNYQDWRNPGETFMVPPVFEYKARDPDDGEKTEKHFFDLLQMFGVSRPEGMFIVHSHKFKEMISEWNQNINKTERKWLTGEHDFVIIHPQRGIVFFQVKAASKTKGKFALANEQLEKDKRSLQAFAVEHLPGKLKKSVDKELYLYPGFVVMPNCPRPNSAQTPSNGIFKEDCATVEAFSDWFDKSITREGTIDQELFSCLVKRFVGMRHSSPCLRQSIDQAHKAMNLKTKEQLEVMLRTTTEQWITGPAGSGKTWLLMEKVKMLSQKAILHESKERILVVCYNLPLSKMLTETFKSHLSQLLNDDLSSVVDVKTYSSLLYEITNKLCGETDREKDEIVKEAVECLERGASHLHRYYDHIFVDECQDLYGDRWPDLFQKLCKEEDDDDDDGLESKHKWFFYDTNQYLGLSERQYQQHRTTLKKSTKLSKVLRNTGNIFDQSRKYFKSPASTREPISIGHKQSGLAIKWNQSLADRRVTVDVGARSIVKHIKELRRNKVKDRDICVLVENTEVRDKLSSELESLKVECQDAEKLHEANEDKVVVESVRRFKGLESKVVLLYNPRFYIDKEWTENKIKELLYVAVSRCFCYLVVITTEKGYKALKSKVGVLEGTFRKRQHHPTLVQDSEGLKAENRSQKNATFNCPFGRRSWESQYESGPPECTTTKPHFEEDDDKEPDETAPPSVKLSRLEEKFCKKQYEKSQKSSEPKRQLKVDGSDLLEPGASEPFQDFKRRNVFQLLCQTVQQNLPFLPSSSAMHHSKDCSLTIVAQIEHEVYSKYRNDVNTKQYTKELRNLKKEIEQCNQNQQSHERVLKAIGLISS